MKLENLTKGFLDKETQIITKAYKFALKSHEGQKRLSGNPYFIHLYETALILKDLGVGAETISAGLLHDITEDGLVDKNIIKKEFGTDISFLVDGVTKLGKIRFRGAKRHVESLRKLFLSTSKDIRVLLIKLSDRLHNMRTLEHIETEIKRRRIASETMEVYAPIAHRLNIGKFSGELEDLSFKHLSPKEYKEVLTMSVEKHGKSAKLLKKIHDSLKNRLKKEKILTAEISYRKKHIYSLYKKLLNKNMNIDNIYDMFALRVITENVSDCYKALGVIHNIWTPLPGRIKDYVASPKPNGYKSIHTSVFTGDGGVVEIQIRTKEMHKEAEYGIASHVSYSENVSKKKATKNLLWFKWINDLAETQKEAHLPEEFMANLRNDFLENRIFVFTPNGDVVDLPTGSSPLDFAYYIHSDIGDHATGAKINNKFVSLKKELQNEDIVEIIINKNSHPTQKWLNLVKTTLAKRSIKQALQKKLL